MAFKLSIFGDRSKPYFHIFIIDLDYLFKQVVFLKLLHVSPVIPYLFNVFMFKLEDVEGQCPHECHVVFRMTQTGNGSVLQIHLQVFGRHWQQTGYDVTVEGRIIDLQEVEHAMQAGHSGRKVAAFEAGVQRSLKPLKGTLKII